MKSAPPARQALVWLFVIYLVLLVWIVLWKVHVPFIGRDDMRGIKLVPFTSGDGFGASDPYELAANLLFFVPFGVYLRLLVPRWHWGRIVGVTAASSLLLEITQFVIAAGSSDVTDLIVNTAGGLVGVILASLVARGLKGRTDAVMAWVLGVGTALALAAIVFIILSFPRMPQPGSGEVVILTITALQYP